MSLCFVLLSLWITLACYGPTPPEPYPLPAQEALTAFLGAVQELDPEDLVTAVETAARDSKGAEVPFYVRIPPGESAARLTRLLAYQTCHRVSSGVAEASLTCWLQYPARRAMVPLPRDAENEPLFPRGNPIHPTGASK